MAYVDVPGTRERRFRTYRVPTISGYTPSFDFKVRYCSGDVGLGRVSKILDVPRESDCVTPNGMSPKSVLFEPFDRISEAQSRLSIRNTSSGLRDPALSGLGLISIIVLARMGDTATTPVRTKRDCDLAGYDRWMSQPVLSTSDYPRPHDARMHGIIICNMTTKRCSDRDGIGRASWRSWREVECRFEGIDSKPQGRRSRSLVLAAFGSCDLTAIAPVVPYHLVPRTSTTPNPN